jgi:aspartyl protease family protein
MTREEVQRRGLKELVVMTAMVTAGYVTFHSFEKVYDTVRVAEAGFFGQQADLDDRPLNPAAAEKRKVNREAIADLRGTVAANFKEPETASSRKVVLTANDYGHFQVDVEINGRSVEFMTDTGATYVALSYEAAQKIGIPLSSLQFNGRSTTANGVARVASINLGTVRIGDIVLHDVEAVVAEPGKMSQNLLGMSFIRRLSGFQLSGKTLTMTQ